jgi:hypothetical protein
LACSFCFCATYSFSLVNFSLSSATCSRSFFKLANYFLISDFSALSLSCSAFFS